MRSSDKAPPKSRAKKLRKARAIRFNSMAPIVQDNLGLGAGCGGRPKCWFGASFHRAKRVTAGAETLRPGALGHGSGLVSWQITDFGASGPVLHALFGYAALEGSTCVWFAPPKVTLRGPLGDLARRYSR